MNKTIVFRIVGSNLFCEVGKRITFNDTETGKITSIRSVKYLYDDKYEIIGRYKPAEEEN